MQTQKITLDFCQNDYKTVTVKQYDKDSRNLIITCTDNGAFYKLDSSTLQCNVKMNTPDDRAIYDTATINEDGTVLVTFSESMVYANGTGKLEIQFIDSSTQKSISTMILTVIIVGSVYPDDKIIASDEFNALTDALLRIESDVNDANEAIERINELEESVTTAEASRVVTEESRVLAESKRVSAENTRTANENTRKTNETARQTAESKRQTDTATAIANAEEAIDRANEIAENCKDLMLGSGISITTTETALEGSKEGLIRIESIGGKCEQFTTTGKSLVDFTEGKTSTNSGVTYTLQPDGSFKRTGTATTDTGNVWMMGNWALEPTDDTTLVTLEAGKHYYIVDCVVFSNQAVIYAYNNDLYVDPNRYPDGFKVTGIRNVFFEIGKTYNDTIYPLICERTEGIDWEPYTGGQPSPNPDYPQEIKKTVVSEIKTHGKNFIDASKTSLVSMTYSNGIYTSSPLGTYGACYIRLDKDVAFKKGDVAYMSAKVRIKSGSGALNWMLLRDEKYAINSEGTEKTNYAIGSEFVTTSCKMTFPEDLVCDTILIQVNSVASNAVLEIKDIMVSLDKDFENYEPYVESSIALSQPIELYGVNGVQDVIEDGKVIRRCGVKVFDGTESIITQTAANTDTVYFLCAETSAKVNDISGKRLTGALCNRLIERTPDYLWNNSYDGFCINSDAWNILRFRLGADITSVELAKAKLKEWYDAGKPMIIVYELATETTEALPAADQIGLNSLLSFDGITYISTDSEVKPVITTEYGTSKTSTHAIEALNKVDNVEVEISEIKPIVEKLQIPDITSTTEATMSNSHDSRLLFKEIGGVCEQNQYTGKNLLNVTLGYSTTKNGVTCTVDNEGVITLNGTASELTIFYAYEALTSKAGKYYKLEAMYISGSTSQKVSASNQDASNGWLGYNADITNSNVVYFYKYAMDLNMLDARGIYVQKDTVINNLKFKLMFIQTDVDGFDSVYEPYTGGIPSPNPDYPQEIRHVRGKNLLDCRGLKEQTTSGVTFTPKFDSEGNLLYIEVDGTATAHAYYYLDETFDCPYECLISGSPTGRAGNTFAIQAQVDSLIYADYYTTPRLPKGKYNVYIVVRSGSTMNKARFYPMIRSISVKNDIYVPYGLLRAKTHGKNFIKPTIGTSTVVGVSVSNNNGTLTLNGTANASDGIYVCNSMHLTKGEYYTNTLCYRRDKNNQWVETIQRNAVFDVVDESQSFFPLIWFNKDQVYNETITPMLCLAEYKDVVEPYKESSINTSPIELCGIGDVQDVIRDGVIKRRFKKIVFNGSEGWHEQATGVSGRLRFALDIADGKNDGKIMSNSLSNELTYLQLYNSNADNVIALHNTVGTIQCVATNYADANAWKTYLASNPMTVVYELAKEVVEDLPLADQIALNSLETYDGITYLEFDSEVQPTFEGEYGTSKVGGYTLEGMLAGLNGELLAKSNADRLSALEATVVNNI